ncbi:DNA breaking-rejoining protein [Salmonella enterica subsp. enterica]|nr:DNA breaking-rejoining protein [Salmonella enterica subsp. enterica serovar Vitkin]
MATKEENIQRLQVLAKLLGREPDISGSAAEIRQRVTEWEEEVSGTDDLNGPENADATKPLPGPGGEARREDVVIRNDRLVLVQALRTLHIDAKAADSERRVDILPAGRVARIPEALVEDLVSAGLIAEL